MGDWIGNFIGAPKRPNGDYGSSHMPDLTSNKVRKIGWPSGVFDEKDNLLSSIKNANKKMGNMSQNLMSNQKITTDFIHIPRIVLPLTIPCVESEGLTELVKSVTSGDVIFNLRYNEQIMKAGLGSRLVRKDGGDSVFSINLASLNYILIGMQRYLHKFEESCIENDKVKYDQKLIEKETNYRLSKAPGGGPVDRKALHEEKYFLWINLITNDDFKNMLQDSFYSGWQDFEGVTKSEITKPRLKSYFTKYICSIVWDFINTYAKLAGVFVGSDNQGGNHYGKSNPSVYAPTDFVGVLQAAGKSRKVRNLWCTCDNGTSGGDILGFRLAKCTKPQTLFFRLSSNVDTQKESHIPTDDHDYCLLIPAKMNSQSVIKSDYIHWIDSNFLQFGICNQISRASAYSVNNIHNTACDATFSTMPAPLEILLRFDFVKLSSFCYCNTIKIKPVRNGGAGGPPGNNQPSPGNTGSGNSKGGTPRFIGGGYSGHQPGSRNTIDHATPDALCVDITGDTQELPSSVRFVEGNSKSEGQANPPTDIYGDTPRAPHTGFGSGAGFGDNEYGSMHINSAGDGGVGGVGSVGSADIGSVGIRGADVSMTDEGVDTNILTARKSRKKKPVDNGSPSSR